MRLPIEAGQSQFRQPIGGFVFPNRKSSAREVGPISVFGSHSKAAMVTHLTFGRTLVRFKIDRGAEVPIMYLKSYSFRTTTKPI